ncbi:unnamed protein product [Dibothriocephalus latus]|uniref:AB hydrolase-1 domain-containing protein n=1 Tax=Dibothriocephalus latus TaxID=60516 RepID=A0A3P7LHE6_DIBLA|nr:unnamed protein product [Dibothriocephalus latus]
MGKRNVVLLQHGLIDSSHTWISNLPNQSLGFILSDMGYDVWLGNSRGSTYSQYHKTLDWASQRFWQFSWDDMARNDFPATIDFVLNQTGKNKLFYIAHSQGTQIAFANLNSDPILRSKISAMVALAPIAYLGNVKSPLRLLSSVCKDIDFVNTWLGSRGILMLFSLVRFFSTFLCHEKSISFLCSSILYSFVGYDFDNTNTTRFPVYFAHAPAGTSVRNMVHYCQASRFFNPLLYADSIAGKDKGDLNDHFCLISRRQPVIPSHKCSKRTNHLCWKVGMDEAAANIFLTTHDREGFSTVTTTQPWFWEWKKNDSTWSSIRQFTPPRHLDGMSVGSLKRGRFCASLHYALSVPVLLLAHFVIRTWSMSHGKFQAFDFGKEENLLQYKQAVPPVYGLSNIDIPLKLYWGGDDWLSTPIDVCRLLNELPRRSYIRNMYLPYYNHIEFVWGLDAAKIIYPDILDFLQEFQ